MCRVVLGGAGQGPVLQYDIRAHNFSMQTYKTTHTTPSDFPRIPLGHIDLRNEIGLDKVVGAASHNSRQNCIRRIYTARVVGRTEPVTVAMYEWIMRGRNGSETFPATPTFGQDTMCLLPSPMNSVTDIPTFFKPSPLPARPGSMPRYLTAIWSL
ncbi:hypothetical protein MSAN_00859800 [Mycena sanguinolenta]|uniref:Uncharacterized protein n=1 Tax=Mycena sanguinolenta TaxID=230812 RepID=A0A8H7DCL7_9AGAR|nr:hypothetical protein MSAN_00859800 [Mycena sanguinolenta]